MVRAAGNSLVVPASVRGLIPLSRHIGCARAAPAELYETTPMVAERKGKSAGSVENSRIARKLGILPCGCA